MSCVCFLLSVLTFDHGLKVAQKREQLTSATSNKLSSEKDKTVTKNSNKKSDIVEPISRQLVSNLYCRFKVVFRRDKNLKKSLI